MAHVQFTDEIVKEYLLFRGFSSTLKAFDNELKTDKDKGFRVEKVVESLLQCVYNYDLAGLKNILTHLETRIFTKLNSHLAAATKKLESALLKFYLVHAIENNKSDKTNEFFIKMTADLSVQADWKDWFTIPYIKSPEENATFAVYFTRQWQDSLFVSLHNFLASAYQNLSLPTLAAFEESASKMAALQKENDVLRRGLANMLSASEIEKTSDPPDVSDIMDDFHRIAQEVRAAEHQSKTLKSFMKLSVHSGSLSPKSASIPAGPLRRPVIKKLPGVKRSSSSDSRVAPAQRERDTAAIARSPVPAHIVETPNSPVPVQAQERPKTENPALQPEGSFLFLSQDEYNEHTCAITRLKLNGRGNIVASLDVNGGLRVWNTPPACRTIAVFPTRPQTDLLEWVLHNERYLLCADPQGPLRLLDVKEVLQVWELAVLTEPDTKIEDIISNPVESSVLMIISGKVIQIDLKTRKAEKTLLVPAEVTSCAFTLNGQQVACGCKDGRVLLLDIRRNEITDSLPTLSSPVIYVHLTIDSSYCFYLAHDRKLRWLSLLTKDKAQTLTFPVDSQISSTRNRPFCLDSSGTFLLTLGSNSGVIYKIGEDGITKCLELGGHKFAVTCIDWCFANQCATCVTASSDGNIRISTLLIDTVSM